MGLIVSLILFANMMWRDSSFALNNISREVIHTKLTLGIFILNDCIGELTGAGDLLLVDPGPKC